MKMIALFCVVLCAGALNGMETSTISPYQTQDKNQIHRELLGKVKKLEGYDDIYVGAGYSDAGEPIFFGMEKLGLKIWGAYANALYGKTRGIIRKLNEINSSCSSEWVREECEKKRDQYKIELMDTMCPNQQKFSKIFSDSGTRLGIDGFDLMFIRSWRDSASIYVAYVSAQPIIGPFKPKKQLGDIPTLEEFEQAYPDIIMSLGVDMKLGTSKTEHRGIFKNPFYDIRGTYKNISMKLHGWAGSVEKQMFHKTYMAVFPTKAAAELLHRMVKPGDMYIGINTESYPYNDEELRKKFPPIKQELIGYESSYNDDGEVLHVFDLNLLSKYYTEITEKK